MLNSLAVSDVEIATSERQVGFTMDQVHSYSFTSEQWLPSQSKPLSSFTHSFLHN